MSFSVQNEVPRHVAIIMDGNGRWAKKQGKPRVFGHRVGKDAVDRVVTYCANQGVETLTLFAFSTENWRRPASEVKVLMSLMSRALKEYLPTLLQHEIALSVLGNRSALSDRLQKEIAQAEQATQNGKKMRLILALNYSGRWAIMQAAKALSQTGLSQEALDRMTEADFAHYFPEPLLPDVDLLIRSSGELRISNFLLWELAYAELYFMPTLWPDVDEKVMEKAFQSYRDRERRFGALPEKEGA